MDEASARGAGLEAELDEAMAQAIAGGALELPPYPAVALRIAELVRAGDFGLDELGKLVASDQVLSADLLRAAQAAVFARSAPVSSISQALTRVGAEGLSRIALASGLGAAALAAGPLAPLRRRTWQDALASAVLCRELARARGLPADDAFTCGLLHDFGRVVAIGAIERIAAGARRPSRPLPARFWEAVVDRHHVALGVVLAVKWSLPRTVRDAIQFHHAPTSEGAEHPALVDVVRAVDPIVASLFDRAQLAAAAASARALSDAARRGGGARHQRAARLRGRLRAPGPAARARAAGARAARRSALERPGPAAVPGGRARLRGGRLRPQPALPARPGAAGRGQPGPPPAAAGGRRALPRARAPLLARGRRPRRHAGALRAERPGPPALAGHGAGPGPGLTAATNVAAAERLHTPAPGCTLGRTPWRSSMTLNAALVPAALALALALAPAAARPESPWDVAKGVAGKSSVSVLEKEINKRLLEESRKNQCSFKSDSDVLEPGCGPKVQRLASALVDAKKKLSGAGVKNFTFVVSGHTDSSGSAAHNKKLSGDRAEVMVRELVKQGISRDEIKAVGMGSERPRVKPDDTAAKKAQNRRYEVQVKL
ncbi:MAG: HDOD domain-containing protein [Anaeromyxobacter sp.]